MSSIPLPALAVRPPEPIQSPIEQYGKVLQLKSLMGQQQLQQGQGQLQQQELQKGQFDIQNREAGMKAMQQWDGKSMEEIPNLLQKNGADLNTVMQARSGIVKYQQELASKTKDELAIEKVKGDFLAQAIDNVKALPPEQQPQAFEQAKAQAVQKGFLDPQQAQGLQYQGPQQLEQMEKLYMGHAAAIESAEKQSQMTSQAAQLPGQQAESQIKQQEAALGQGGASQGYADAKYRALTQAKSMGNPIVPQDAAWLKAYEKQKTLVPVANFNLQNALPGGQNGQPNAMAQAVANGQMKWQDVISPRTPMSVKQQFAAEVKAINPNFNSGDFTTEQKVNQAFTSGDFSKQLNAINTARNHMQTFSQLADAINNGDVQAANKIGNAFGVQFGSDKATNFKIASQAFGGEVGKAFDGAGVTQSERESASQAFNPNMSPQQFRGAVKTVDNLLQGKQNALKQTYEQGRKAQPNFGNQASPSNAADPFAQFGGKAH